MGSSPLRNAYQASAEQTAPPEVPLRPTTSKSRRAPASSKPFIAPAVKACINRLKSAGEPSGCLTRINVGGWRRMGWSTARDSGAMNDLDRPADALLRAWQAAEAAPAEGKR